MADNLLTINLVLKYDIVSAVQKRQEKDSTKLRQLGSRVYKVTNNARCYTVRKITPLINVLNQYTLKEDYAVQNLPVVLREGPAIVLEECYVRVRKEGFL